MLTDIKEVTLLWAKSSWIDLMMVSLDAPPVVLICELVIDMAAKL